MQVSKNNSNLPFIILGIAAAVSGIIITYSGKYFFGISSTIVGIGLVVRNYTEYKNNKE